MRNLLIALLFLSAPAWAQIDAAKVDALSKAIARAEGFYRHGTIPNRYYNPGDLKSRPGLTPLPGQKRIGKAGHIVFINDAAGWAALHEYITKIAEGRSHLYATSMTLTQVSRIYAQQWRPWLKQVTAQLGVPGTTRIDEFVEETSPDIYDGFCYTM